jgi:hypothetical protein
MHITVRANEEDLANPHTVMTPGFSLCRDCWHATEVDPAKQGS